MQNRFANWALLSELDVIRSDWLQLQHWAAVWGLELRREQSSWVQIPLSSLFAFFAT